MKSLANGRRRNQLVHRVLKAMVAAHPAAFFPKDSPRTQPLAIGIIDALIAAHPEIDQAELRTFISVYTQKSRYLRALVDCTHRVDLDGAPAVTVKPWDRERAKNALAKRAADATRTAQMDKKAS